MASRHIPVLLDACLTWLNVGPGKRFVDCTTNGAGHAYAILEAGKPDAQLIGLDMDAQTLDMAREKLSPFGERATLVHSNFADLRQALSSVGVDKVDGILADLGLSSNQLDSGARGFSFTHDGPIDMRMDKSRDKTAADVIADSDERELTRIISTYGEERFAKRIAGRLKTRLAEGTLATTAQLAEAVSDAIPRKFHPKRIHPATKTFQALRIATNSEMENLDALLGQALGALKPGGRLAIISYHSLEDRMVRQTFKHWERECICPPKLPICQCDKKRDAHILTRKPITADETEIARNPRARSAKLRVAERSEA